MSRRVFLKNGAFAFVSLGFAPSFLARTALRGRRLRPAEAAHRDLPARRRRRPQHRRPVRRGRVLPGAAEHRDRASGGGAEAGAIDLDGFFGFHPRLQPLKPLWDARQLADRARVRIARQHALAFRRAGLHGERHAGRQEHARRMAEPLPAGAARAASEAATPFRAVALTSQLPRMLQGTAPALAMSQLAQFGIRGGQASDDGRRVVRSGVRRGAPIRC